MLNRRDQVQAYRFVQARLNAALLYGDPDRPDSPMTRLTIAMLSGVMVAVLLIAGFGVYGLVRPGGKDSWRTTGVLVIEKETGARFVYDGNDQALHPVLNYASARLILNNPNPSTSLFSRDSLRGARRGAALGLAGLPDALPDGKGLIEGPWTVCSEPVEGGSPAITVVAGAAVPGPALGDGGALLVTLPDGSAHLLWRGRRLLVRDPAHAAPALSLDRAAAVAVAPAWVNTVPPGPDLAAPKVAGAGQSAPYEVGSRPVRLGQVLRVGAEGGVAARYFLVTPDGVAPLTNTAALLTLGDPATAAAYSGASPTPIDVPLADLSATRQPKASILPPGFPDQVPVLRPVAPGAALCAAYTDTSGASLDVALSTSQRSPALAAGTAAVSGGVRLALPPGRAALVSLLPHGGQKTNTAFLVTEEGVKYPIPSVAAKSALGYGSVVPVPLPAGIADLIRTGPALDPAKANRSASAAGDLSPP